MHVATHAAAAELNADPAFCVVVHSDVATQTEAGLWSAEELGASPVSPAALPQPQSSAGGGASRSPRARLHSCSFEPVSERRVLSVVAVEATAFASSTR